MLFLIFSVGNFSPIVPVHANNISFESIFSGFSSSFFCFRDSSSDKLSAKTFNPLNPSFPVKAFAFRVLTKIALIFFLLIFKFHLIFSEINFDCV